MNLIDKIIAPFSPNLALKRAHSRSLLAKYEAATPTKHYKPKGDKGSGDVSVGIAGDKLRIMARDFEQNHDIARGILSTLVNNIVGTGIRYEPMVKNINGELHEEVNDKLLELHKDWAKKPDVTGEYSLGMAERLAARAWMRDGEMFTRHHLGRVPSLKHDTKVEYSIELIEADQVPFDINDANKKIIQGVGKDKWGKPIEYHTLDGHPYDLLTISQSGKTIKAEYMLHLKIVDRIRQTRGVSVFASVLRRLGDLKDYEDSERIAARISAKMVAYIKNGMPEDYSDSPESDPFEVVEDGMIFYNMTAGSEVGTIDTNRPNVGLDKFRKTQLQATASGVSTGYSSISKNYDGNYAAQRQEMVEQKVNYAVLEEHFIAKFSRPIYEKFVQMAMISGLEIPADVDMDTILDVQCTGTPQPWVDPLKEVKADTLSLQFGMSSLSGIIRKRGGNPTEVFAQIKRDRNALGDDAYTYIFNNLSNSKKEEKNA